MSKGTKVLIIILVILIVVAGGVLAYKIYESKQPKEEPQIAEEPQVVEEKQVQIYQGTDRPIAVMIDNHHDAWPQAGLNQAYMVYEIIVEGGETRLMALFKGADLEKIGPVRSARHYFLDYALENDAIYVHYGWSPQAEKDIARYSVDNINGISESEKHFWRVKDKKSPHNVATSTQAILEIAQNKKYKTTSDATSVLKYVADEFNLSDKYTNTVQNAENTTNTTTNIAVQNTVETANIVRIQHSQLHKASYEYNPETKRYTRYARGEAQHDWDTQEPITTKNIIIEFIDNSELNDGENKGRQTLNNIGTFDGYYITNGQAIKIKCIKSARDEKTIYQDLQGNEIEINDGNTWVNICPKNADVEIVGAATTENNVGA